MTEAIKFPGTEMEIFEKYPDSRRLDFPSFGDVCKTTFAKGTITDFEKVSDDPIMVKPRVKVTGDFGESEYIPLFFHPQAKYWDDEIADPPVLATDFDEETGSFKQAWQSFRGGDEVAVMLKEGVPVAVLGFADGVPRVGEDIVKVSTQSVVTSFDYEGNTDDDKIINQTWPDAYLQMSQVKMYQEAEKGLDGLDLKLLNKADLHEGPITKTSSASWFDSWGDWPGPESVPGIDDAPYGTVSACVGGGCQYYILGLGSASENTNKVSLWIVIVGPILYAVFGLWFNNRRVSHIGCSKDDPDTGTAYDGYLRETQNIYGYERLMIKAAIYKEETKDAIIQSLNDFTYAQAKAISGSHDWWPVTPEGVVYQKDLSVKSAWLCFFDQKISDEVEWFTRPHTKVELQAARMWPAGAS